MIIFPVPFQGQSLQAGLKKQLIQDYLLDKGDQKKESRELPAHKAWEQLAAVSRCASLKLAEIESRSRFINSIRFIS